MKAALCASLFAVATADSLAITWSDCGAKHAVTKDVQPSSLPLGTETELIGTGTVDEEVTGGTYDNHLTAGGGLIDSHLTGNNCEAKTFNLPLGIGTLTWEGIQCPLAAGDAQIKFKVKLSSSLPPTLATSDINLTAKDQNGEDLLCTKLHLEKATTSLAEIAEQVNSKATTWTAQAPGNFKDTEEVKAYLGAHLPGDAEYKTSEVKDFEVNVADLPDSFDSATQWPKCSVIANVRDQSACGSCWAFGSVSSFESRACITTGRDVKYSPQATAFNQGIFGAGNGCNGGNSAWGYFKNTGVPTGGDYTDIGKGDTCQPYGFAPCAHHVPATEKYPACPSGEYPNPKKSTKCSEDSYATDFESDSLHASKTYSVRGVDKMMQELVTNGPMYVSFTVYDDFPTYKSGVYQPTSHKMLGGHAVTLVGFGTEDGTPYWKIKNSWNEQWGDGGHFKIIRGKNSCGIEGDANAGDIQTSYETTV